MYSHAYLKIHSCFRRCAICKFLLSLHIIEITRNNHTRLFNLVLNSLLVHLLIKTSGINLNFCSALFLMIFVCKTIIFTVNLLSISFLPISEFLEYNGLKPMASDFVTWATNYLQNYNAIYRMASEFAVWQVKFGNILEPLPLLSIEKTHVPK